VRLQPLGHLSAWENLILTFVVASAVQQGSCRCHFSPNMLHGAPVRRERLQSWVSSRNGQCRTTNMFEGLLDFLSSLWSGSWPEAIGEITDVGTARVRTRYGYFLQLIVSYKFSIGDDGPYTGEDYWQAYPFGSNRQVIRARQRFRTGDLVVVRYRKADPSTNKIDRSVWETYE
jgi:hypothetical protein